MEALYATNKPLEVKEIWKIVSSDLNSITELGTIMAGLHHAEKIQQDPGKGWLPKREIGKHSEEFLNLELKKSL